MWNKLALKIGNLLSKVMFNRSQTRTAKIFVSILILNLLNSCGGGNDPKVIIPIDQTNILPTVYAGVDHLVQAQTLVQLSASASDNDGFIKSYHWSQLDGNDLTLNNPDSASASFTAPALSDARFAESYTIKVEVKDDQDGVASDSITIIVEPVVFLLECDLTISPGVLFTDSFAQLSPGQTLCLNDGKYVQAMEIPSDINVRAVNDGMAEIDGAGTLGLEWLGGVLTMKGNNASVRGLRVHHATTNSDACSIGGKNNTMRVMSCSHGGQHKHKLPLKVTGSGHLIEDSWFFGEGRYVFECYSGNNITIRRNVMRWDKTIAGEPDEPNAAMSNYSCSDMIWENNISLDYAIPETEMIHCGDICMSTIDSAEDNATQNYRVRYLGNMVVNHSPDTLNNRAFRADQKGNTPSSDITIKDFYVKQVGIGITINPIYQNVVVSHCTMIEVTATGLVNDELIICNGDADIFVRYLDGFKTIQPLFPFAHEALIKRDLCAADERQSDWCLSTLSLQDYILN